MRDAHDDGVVVVAAWSLIETGSTAAAAAADAADEAAASLRICTLMMDAAASAMELLQCTR